VVFRRFARMTVGFMRNAHVSLFQSTKGEYVQCGPRSCRHAASCRGGTQRRDVGVGKRRSRQRECAYAPQTHLLRSLSPAPVLPGSALEIFTSVDVHSASVVLIAEALCDRGSSQRHVYNVGTRFMLTEMED